MAFTSIKLSEIEMCEILEDKEEEREKRVHEHLYRKIVRHRNEHTAAI